MRNNKQRSPNSFSSNRCISVSVKAFQRNVVVRITTWVGGKTESCKLMNRSFSLLKTHRHLSFFFVRNVCRDTALLTHLIRVSEAPVW